MKSPFQLQVSNYDCAPVTFANALSYLFSRSKIPQEVIARIQHRCLDETYGTSKKRIKELGEWLNEYKRKNFRVKTSFLQKKKNVNEMLTEKLGKRSVALLRVTHGDNWHYVLAMFGNGKWLYCFDPYKMKRSTPGFKSLALKKLHAPNLKIRIDYLNRENDWGFYHMGTSDQRHCLLIEKK